jgi:hypothetical protein
VSLLTDYAQYETGTLMHSGWVFFTDFRPVDPTLPSNGLFQYSSVYTEPEVFIYYVPHPNRFDLPRWTPELGPPVKPPVMPIPAAVPEPGTWILGLLTLVAFIVYERLTNRRKG